MPAKSRKSAAPSIAKLIATELGISERQVETVIELLEEGATVPFIARYRKERTGGLDDTQLRSLAERLDYLTELAKRRDTILDAIQQECHVPAHELCSGSLVVPIVTVHPPWPRLELVSQYRPH